MNSFWLITIVNLLAYFSVDIYNIYKQIKNVSNSAFILNDRINTEIHHQGGKINLKRKS